MPNHIKCGIYHLDVRDFEHDIAHLYEHLLIMSFEKVLERHGLSKYLYGWISGHTFREVVFIEYGLYNPAVEKLFTEYMARSRRIDFSLLDNELLRIQAEDEAIIERVDKGKLVSQLDALDHRMFSTHEHEFTPLFLGKPLEKIPPDILVLRRAKKSFRTLAIHIGVRDMSDDEQLAFLRLTPAIYDAISTALFRVGMYGQGTSWPIGKPLEKGMVGVAIYTIRRGLCTAKQIKNQVRAVIGDLKYDIEEHPAELKHYIDGFVSTPNWNTFPINYFEKTGIVASKQQIREAFTVKTIQTILGKMEFLVTDATRDHWDQID